MSNLKQHAFYNLCLSATSHLLVRVWGVMLWVIASFEEDYKVVMKAR